MFTALITLNALWEKIAGPKRDDNSVVYEVRDPDTITKLRKWMEQDRKAVAAINEHLDRIILHRPYPVQYKTDLAGIIRAISFCGYMPHGWEGIPSETGHWLKPVTREARAGIAALPVASRLELHDLIGWPTFEKTYLGKNDHDLADKLNHTVTPFEEDGRIYVRVPDHRSFAACPPLYNAVARWVEGQETMETPVLSEPSP